MNSSPHDERFSDSSSPSAPRGWRVISVVTGLLLVLSPLIPLSMGFTVPYGSLAPFYAIIAILLISAIALLVFCLRRRRGRVRGRAAAGALDYLWIAAVALGAVGHWVLAVVVAGAYGLSGSAWPRVRAGIEIPGDYAYLVSLGLSVVVLCGAGVVVVLLVLSGLKRSPLERMTDAAGTLRLKAAEGPEPVPMKYITGPGDRFLARMFSPASRLLLLFGVAVSIAAVPVAVLNDGTLAQAAVWLILMSPVAVSLWAVIESLWRPDEQLGIAMLALAKTMVVPASVGLVLGAATLVPAAVPALWNGFLRRQWPEEFFAGIFETVSSLGGWLGMNALMGLLFGMLGGLALSVAVIFPWLAFFRPDQAIRDNMLTRDPQHRRRNIAVSRVISLLLILIFLIPGLMNWGRMYDTQWWVGAALIPVAVGLGLYVYLSQRVDHERRRRWFMQAPVPSPNDPRPRRDDQPHDGQQLSPDPRS